MTEAIRDTDVAQPIPEGSALTPYDAAVVATGFSVEQIEELVRRLAPADVPLLLRRLDQATTLLNVAKKIGTLRMLEDGRLGETWTAPEGEEYTFAQTRRGEYDDVVGLFVTLNADYRIPWSALVRSVGSPRVTDLENAIATHASDAEGAMSVLKDHRVWKEGTARLEPLENKYRRKK